VASLTLPTLIVWGDQDRLLHVSMATAFQRAIRGSRRVEMPGIGHLPFLEAPGKTRIVTLHPPKPENAMSKGMERKKETKKKPLKTPQEKRDEKKEKQGK
jgi:hypothetical protein